MVSQTTIQQSSQSLQWHLHILWGKLVDAHTLTVIFRKLHIKLVDSCHIINFCNSTVNQYDQSIHFNTHCRLHEHHRFQWHLAHLLCLKVSLTKYKTVSSTFLCWYLHIQRLHFSPLNFTCNAGHTYLMVGLALSKDPESYTGSSIAPGRASHAR
jgi:hypothetical protein